LLVDPVGLTAGDLGKHEPLADRGAERQGEQGSGEVVGKPHSPGSLLLLFG
jgi:hypothetical protein